nr:nuclear pore complex protein NUP1-like isoform X1 [Tanacetum cinerariifolium]
MDELVGGGERWCSGGVGARVEFIRRSCCRNVLPLEKCFAELSSDGCGGLVGRWCDCSKSEIKRLTALLHSRSNESSSADVVERDGANPYRSPYSLLRLEASTSGSLKKHGDERDNLHAAISTPMVTSRRTPSLDANLAHVTNNSLGWYVDFGASAHMTYSVTNLDSAMPYSSKDQVILGNGKVLDISHVGTSSILLDVLVVPHIIKNLLCTRKLTSDSPVDILFLTKTLLFRTDEQSLF